MLGQLKVKTFAAQCALVVGMMGAASVAVAASSSSAAIDWSSLAWSATNGATLNWAGLDDYVYADFNNGVSTDSSSAGPVQGGFVSAGGVGTYAYGLTTNVLTNNSISSAASTVNPGERTVGESARYNYFSVVDSATGASDVTFTVNYVMKVGVDSSIGEAESAVEFKLYNLNSTLGWEDDYFVSQVGNGADSIFGVFSLTEEFLNGDSGYVFGSTYAYAGEFAPADVPEPGVLSLLGIGLLGLWGASRRRAAYSS